MQLDGVKEKINEHSNDSSDESNDSSRYSKEYPALKTETVPSNSLARK